MAEIKWIKITTDMFDNRKIKHLRKLPEGNNIVLIWVMLLTMAGRCNAGGMVFLTENIPYTTKMLADELDFEESTVKLAIQALEHLGMVTTSSEGFLSVSGWEEHQNIEGMEKIRESRRLAQARWRSKQKAIPEKSTVDSTVDSTEIENNHADIDKEEDKEEDKKEDKRVDYQLIADLYNETCVSFPRIRALSDSRKKAIKARLKTYSIEDFRTLFQKAEASDFLKGKNNRNWTATFDWLICDSNMAKVLDGNYDDRKGGGKHEADSGSHDKQYGLYF